MFLGCANNAVPTFVLYNEVKQAVYYNDAVLLPTISTVAAATENDNDSKNDYPGAVIVKEMA